MYLKDKLRLIYIYIIPMMLIFMAGIYRLGEHLYPIIYGDEYGYWAAGSYFAGLHWEDVTTINPYYGFGYGLFLSLIIRFVHDPIIDYRIALWCNVIALCITYLLIYRIQERILRLLKKKLPEKLKVMIGMVVASYPSYIQSVNYTWAEIPTMLFTWIGVFFVILYIDENRNISQILLIVVSILMISIHLRNIGFLLAAITFLIFVNLITGQKKRILIIFPVLAIGMMIFYFVKDKYTSEYYVELVNNLHDSTNEGAGVFNKVLMLLTWEGFMSFVSSLCGKVFYLFVATYGVAIVPIVLFARRMVCGIKKRQLEKIDYMLLFAMLLASAMVGICSIFVIQYDSRFDLLMYGRYFENSVPVLLLLGMIILSTTYKEAHRPLLIGSGLFFLFICKIVEGTQNYSLPTSNVFCNLTLVAKWLIRNNYKQGTLVIVTMFSILMFLAICVCLRMNNKSLAVCLLSTIVIYQISTASFVTEMGFYNWAIAENASDLELAEVIRDLNIQDDLTFYPNGFNTHADGLQYLLMNSTIHVIGEICGEEKYVLTSAFDSINAKMKSKGYENIGVSKRLILWKKSNQ